MEDKHILPFLLAGGGGGSGSEGGDVSRTQPSRLDEWRDGWWLAAAALPLLTADMLQQEHQLI